MSAIVTAAARPATMDDVPGVARVLSRALHDDPLLEWLFPESDSHLAKTRRFFALVAGFGYVPAGDTRITELSDSPDGPGPPVARGVALWAPPDTTPEVPLVSVRTWPHWAAMIGWSRMRTFLRVFGEWKLAAPPEDHLYLMALGVDPSVLGSGVAGGLLTEGLDRADSERLPVFTQTFNVKSVGLYEHFGFRVVREVNHPEIGTNFFLQRSPA